MQLGEVCGFCSLQHREMEMDYVGREGMELVGNPGSCGDALVLGLSEGSGSAGACGGELRALGQTAGSRGAASASELAGPSS